MKYFSIHEFDCPCCGENEMNVDFITLLDKARGKAGAIFDINSGYRCNSKNEKVGGSKTSSHLNGFAADIKALHSRERSLIVQALIESGFNRIGISKSFIHVDADPLKKSNVIWLY